jgi:hypothetical protein
MNRWTGMKSDPMQYQGLPAASALDASLPASTVPPHPVYDKPLQYSTGTKYDDMTGTQKCVFVVKLGACICTFGYLFPNVQHD